MSEPVTVVWFRNDRRLDDQPALQAAAARGRVVPVHVWSPEEEAPWAPGGAWRWWLHHSLQALGEALSERGLRLVLKRGETLRALREVAEAVGADAVYWCRRYEPVVIERDRRVKEALRSSGLEAESFNGQLLYEPWEVKNQTGDPYRVFTPFYKATQKLLAPAVAQGVPPKLRGVAAWPEGETLAGLGLLPGVDWAAGMREAWTPGEDGARARLACFAASGVSSYQDRRDYPSEDRTSGLSPYLAHGEVSPRRVWHTLNASVDEAAQSYLRQLVWREFAYHILFHFPRTPEQPLQDKFAGFPWAEDAEALARWQRGRTGYPIVDAGMRQLWHTGWMHNRVRMVVASFLVKDLLLSWEAGARWFWDTLVDADLANNTLGWQWAGGCGADAAPYFRVFNPMLQSKKFDADGVYLKRWLPELAGLEVKAMHAPWEAKPMALEAGGVTLGGEYPWPMVEHSAARDRALEAFESVKKKN